MGMIKNVAGQGATTFLYLPDLARTALIFQSSSLLETQEQVGCNMNFIICLTTLSIVHLHFKPFALFITDFCFINLFYNLHILS